MKTRPQSRPSRLIELGLSELEAAVYAFLAAESPASGYRIAQGLGRPVGNIYKAIESLEDRGAVMTADDNGTRVARAVPLEEFAARLRHELESACEAAREELAAKARSEPDALVYHLRDRAMLFERARTIIRCARRFVVGVATPVFMAQLGEELAAAAARGVPVAIKVFEQPEAALGAVRVIPDVRGGSALDAGPGQWLMLNADGAAMIEGLLDITGEEFAAAHWSENPLVAWNSYTGVVSNLMLALVRGKLLGETTVEEIRRELESMQPYRTTRSEGKAILIRRFREPARRKRGSRGGEGGQEIAQSERATEQMTRDERGTKS